KKRVVSSIADERMLETVSRFRRTSTANNQLGADQPIERPPQLRLVEGGQRRNQLVGELAANTCADLRHYFGPAETVEAGHERVLQRRRDRQRKYRCSKFELAVGLSQVARFEDRLGQFLEEQRYAVGLIQDPIEQLNR